MKYVSTRGGAPAVDLRTALLQGLAPDGGLYVPERVPVLSADVWTRMHGAPLAEIGVTMCAPYAYDVPETELKHIISGALSFPIPLVDLEPGVRVLELFHGPTLAFKDVGARFMARLLGWYQRDAARPLTLLVATSGDTGGAVAQAFHGVPGTRVAVLYPRGRVSPMQEKQFATLGGNVRAYAVDGSFDDCQRMVKEVLEHRDALNLSTANSINIGRLLPQSVYYAHAIAQRPDGSPAIFCTPSGNFGNLTAGLLAQAMGMPCDGFVAATNGNDVVPEYLASGEFRPRASIAHLSNAMDVGNPSNVERMRWLFRDDLAKLRAAVTGVAHGDDATRETIRDVHARTGYVMDPHTAIGYRGLRDVMQILDAPVEGILLATAHPAKFGEAVSSILGRPIEVPERLAALADRELVSKPVAADGRALKAALSAWASS